MLITKQEAHILSLKSNPEMGKTQTVMVNEKITEAAKEGKFEVDIFTQLNETVVLKLKSHGYGCRMTHKNNPDNDNLGVDFCHIISWE